MKRYQIVAKTVERWCKFYDLPPFFWVKPGIRAHVIGPWARLNELGSEEDRADCVAMIVGTLYAKGFGRRIDSKNSELVNYLQLSAGSVSDYLRHYKMMPNETRRTLLAIDGEQAPEFYRSIIVDAQLESVERLEKTRDAISRRRAHA